MPGKVATPHLRIAVIANRQYGLITTRQLRELGICEDAIRSHTLAGRLHRVQRGVYAVGHTALSFEASLFASVLALGGGPSVAGRSTLDCWGAAASHRSAASLWGMLPIASGPSDVIVPGSAGRGRRAGIRIHRSRTLSPTHVTLRHRIPLTTPARTIADLRDAFTHRRSGRLAAWEIRKAIRQADVIGLPVESANAADRTRSDLEGAFLSICKRHRLPWPEVNVRIGPFLVDFLWRGEWLVVETDGYRYHRGRASFQEDRRRELELMRLGYHVLRLSEAQIDEAPGDVAEVLGAELRRRGSQPPGESVSPGP